MNPPDEDLSRRHDALLREPGASVEGAEPLSPWAVFFFLGLVFFATGYLFFNSGDFDAAVFDPGHSAADATADVATTDPMVVGKRVFLRNCAICHQESGEGLAGQFPPLVGSEWVLGQEPHGDNHIVAIVLHGLQGPVTVKGRQFNNVMVPWAALLSDDQIAAVLTYVRNAWGNQAPAISPEFVAKIREETKAHSDAWHPQELLTIKPEKAPLPPEVSPTPKSSPSPSP